VNDVFVLVAVTSTPDGSQLAADAEDAVANDAVMNAPHVKYRRLLITNPPDRARGPPMSARRTP
jgi:hypothetical protein